MMNLNTLQFESDSNFAVGQINSKKLDVYT